MKKKLIKLAFAVLFIVLSNVVYSQDVCKMNPSHCKLLSDTAGVKMMLITLQPGDKLLDHTHPWHFGYVLKGGLYKWTTPEGEIKSAEMKEGSYFAGAPEATHYSWNGGKTTIQFVMYEKQE
jgi:quercetin dioxygenase-like cupin family protein